MWGYCELLRLERGKNAWISVIEGVPGFAMRITKEMDDALMLGHFLDIFGILTP